MANTNAGRLQFIRTVRDAFSYLVKDFGYDEEAITDQNKLALAYSNGRTRIVVEGRDWGLNARVALGSANAEFENFDLEDLMTIRPVSQSTRPPQGSLKSGSHQLDQVRFYADVLRKIGEDVLNNDRQVFPKLKRISDLRAESFRRSEDT